MKPKHFAFAIVLSLVTMSLVHAQTSSTSEKRNYRGSTNYGETFKMQIREHYFKQGYEDIMSGVDYLIAQGLVDGSKMGAMGWSAGGHWSNWILTHTDRFKANSSGAGAMNWNAKTPTLIHVVDGDPRVPRPQSEELHMALKKLGVPTEFFVYPGNTHGIPDPRNQVVKMTAEFNWFEKWIKGKEGWFSWKELVDSVK